MKLHPSSRPAPRFAAVLLTIAALLAPASAAKPPHIVIVYADDLGQGDLSCYNPKAAYQTPRIDRMAAEGNRTGMKNCEAVPPPEVKCFTGYLRASGYYCSNARRFRDENHRPAHRMV